jgi:hypothetical protein
LVGRILPVPESPVERRERVGAVPQIAGVRVGVVLEQKTRDDERRVPGSSLATRKYATYIGGSQPNGPPSRGGQRAIGSEHGDHGGGGDRAAGERPVATEHLAGERGAAQVVAA